MEKFCQSCGMLLRGNQGTNEDQILSKEYCHYCWKGGVFATMPVEITTGKEMQKFTYDILINEYQENPIKAWFLTFGIPSLKRWKNKR